MPDKKIAAITAFVVGLAEIRKAVKEDAKLMLAAIPTNILLDESALVDYLEEMTVELSRRHLLNDKGKIPAAPAKLIRDYVREMAVVADD